MVCPQVRGPDDSQLQTVLAWCADVLGPQPFTLSADQTCEHARQRASAIHLLTPSGGCYLKLHCDHSHWENEIHAYERWAPAFGGFAPRLLAVRDVEPLALVISALPGQTLEQHPLDTTQEQAVWYAAGRALAGLHSLGSGESIGPCYRDGSPNGPVTNDAQEYVTRELDGWLARGEHDILSADELAIAQSARRLIPAFAGERPTPCHRDYCAANWLVGDAGAWKGATRFGTGSSAPRCRGPGSPATYVPSLRGRNNSSSLPAPCTPSARWSGARRTITTSTPKKDGGR